MPLAIAVSVQTDDGNQYTRLLLARPFTPNVTSFCKAPHGFWVDRYTTWCWETEGPSKASSVDLDEARWSLRPRYPNWVLRIGRRGVVALQGHNQVLQTRRFHMRIAQWSRHGSQDWHSDAGSAIKSVQVSIMPSYVFPTYRQWQPDTILAMMSKEAVSGPEHMVTFEEARNAIEHEGAEEVETKDETADEDIDVMEAPHEEAFSEAAVNAHQFAKDLFAGLRGDINADLNEQVAVGLYLGYSVDAPWCVTTFNV